MNWFMARHLAPLGFGLYTFCVMSGGREGEREREKERERERERVNE